MLPTIGSALELRREIEQVACSIADVDPSTSGLIEIVSRSEEIGRLCDVAATHHRRTSPAALACARLAVSSSDLALEALTETPSWTGGAALSRRARQLIEIQQLRDRLHRTAVGVEQHFFIAPAHANTNTSGGANAPSSHLS